MHIYIFERDHHNILTLGQVRLTQNTDLWSTFFSYKILSARVSDPIKQTSTLLYKLRADAKLFNIMG